MKTEVKMKSEKDFLSLARALSSPVRGGSTYLLNLGQRVIHDDDSFIAFVAERVPSGAGADFQEEFPLFWKKPFQRDGFGSVFVSTFPFSPELVLIVGLIIVAESWCVAVLRFGLTHDNSYSGLNKKTSDRIPDGARMVHLIAASSRT